ncbi:MAG: SCO family protein [Gammaproteobacteria bacterium]|nr:SCO family protein [Gammaproteobacteria bacterium]
MKRLAWLALVASALCTVGAASAAAVAKPLPGNSVYQLQAKLLDASGRPRQWSEFRGQPRIATMFYVSCPYMCPLIIESGKAIDMSLTQAERARLGVVMVSLDPKRDSPAALTALAKKRGIDARRWTLLRPEPKDVRSLAAVLGIKYRALADGEFNHTSVLILLDADGRILARTETIGTKPDPEFLIAVRKALASR